MRHSWRCEGHRHCGEDLSEPTHKGSRIVKYHKSCMNIVAKWTQYGDKCFLHGGLKADREKRYVIPPSPTPNASPSVPRRAEALEEAKHKEEA